MLHTLIKIPIKDLIGRNFDMQADRETEIYKGYLVSQGDSLLFDQIERLRGKPSLHIEEVILVSAVKNPRQEKELRHLLEKGFRYNGVHYARFGKSASQGKEGITAFVCDGIFDELYRITQMDIPVKECVISKYEAQRCLVFSSCTLIRDYMPNIVIIGEYEKILPDQLIKYVTEREREFTDPETGERRRYTAREIEEGYKDLKLSPFDGCGCHEWDFTERISAQLGLDYNAVGAQIRLPFIKGYSVYVPFRQILKTWGYEYITDIYGSRHPIDTIDCIWNTSMFKGHGIFLEKYGRNAWNEYMNTLKKYAFKLGISKYSHHIRHISPYTRMNFQYLQCLDLWNPKYIAHYEKKGTDSYDILDGSNAGKIINLAKYTTSLFEKIIRGDKFYTFRFLGITDTEDYEPESRYLEAALQNDRMLQDPAIKQFLYRKLKKAIDEAKTGKIYCSGFYHTGVGDMIGYLQYAAGLEPTGCLKEGELYSANFDGGGLVSFRSPLIDPSEVNRIKNAPNALTGQWLHHFKDQDIVMFNLYDASAPQQGGADFDGDIFLLSDDPVLIDSKIDKKIILDMEDKVTARSKPYTAENLTDYEVMTRDSRIGEITNVATSIENKYTTDENIRKLYEDDISLLRVFQGKEIDFLKTGLRWHMNGRMRKYLDRLPFFLLYHYPAKMKTYRSIAEKNRRAEKEEDKAPLNAYHSPSPMNELCEYLCAWEKKQVLWNHDIGALTAIRPLIIDTALDLSDRKISRICRKYINQYAADLKQHISSRTEKFDAANEKLYREETTAFYRKKLLEEIQGRMSPADERQADDCPINGRPSDNCTINERQADSCPINGRPADNCSINGRQADRHPIDERLIANYVISASYASVSVSKAFAWSAYGAYIIENLQKHTQPGEAVSIREVPAGTEGAYEYLGKYYRFQRSDTNQHE